MVKKALDGTSTTNDFYTVFDNVVATNPQLNKTITEVRNENNLFLVKVLRFYTRRDMAYVEELDSGKKYYCHLTHEMLSYEVSLNCMCDGNVHSDAKYGTYVKPSSNIYGVVGNVRFKGISDEKCLLCCLNYNDNNKLRSDVRNGEIRLTSGNSNISLTKERINITTPRLFVNGLPYEEPKLDNYYDKTEINTIKSDTDAQIKELDDNLFDKIYPIGSIYMSMNSTDPSILFGGTWQQIKDTFLLACGDTYNSDGDVATAQHGSADATLVSHQHGTSNSGEYFVTSESDGANNTRVTYSSSGNRYVDGMTTSSTPFHHRVGTGYVGSSGTGKNMPPYIAVYMWKRTG